MSLQALWHTLPISAEQKSVYLIAEVTPYSVRYHHLENLPVWGMQLVATKTISTSWRKALDEICRPFDYEFDDAAWLLLANGVLVQRGHAIRLDDVASDLLKALQAAALPQGVDYLLPIGAPVLPGVYDLIASASGAKSSLAPLYTAAFPEAEMIAAELAQKQPRLPWRVMLVVARLHEGRLVEDRFEFFHAGAQPTAPDLFRSQNTFYFVPGETKGRAILTKASEGQSSEVVVSAVELVALSGRTEIACEMRFPSADPRLVTGASHVGRVLPQDRTLLRISLPSIVQKAEPVDVAFLLDGTMAAPDFERGRALIVEVVRSLTDGRSPIRFGCVIYGEYRRLQPGMVAWRPDFEARRLAFGSSQALVGFLQEASCLTPFDNDYCDAMELGLQYIAQLDWSQAPHFLIVVGNSPPHPRRQDFTSIRHLVDHGTGEFLNIDWEQQLSLLKSRGPLYLCSIWIEPSEGPRPQKEHRVFARLVWDRLGENLRLAGDADTAERIAASVRGARRTIRGLDSPLGLPMPVPLIGIEPA